MKPTIREVQTRVAKFYGLPHQAMIWPIRTKEIAHPRQVAMYIARRKTGHSWTTLGLHFGGRDHTTVMHAIRAVEARRVADPELNNQISVLEREFA